MNDQEFNIKFVGKVKKREVLYNYYLPGYSRKDVIERAWQEVADEVNLSVSECKDKWRNLRTVFIRKLKPLPNGSQRKRRKAYYLADAMDFCLPFIKVLDSLPRSSFKQEEPEEILFEPERCDDESNSREEEDLSELVQPELAQPKAKKTKLDINVGEVATSAGDVARLDTNFEAENSHRAERKEALKMFLLSVIPEVEEFSDNQIKLFKRKIFRVIDEISGTSYNSDPLHN